MNNITTIILTYNEEINIEHSINSVKEWSDVFVVDSFSKDKTCEIATSLGTKVVKKEFESYAKQRNWSIKNEPFGNEWILFLDADEVIFEELKNEILKTIKTTNLDGFYLKRRFYFMDRWIRFGGIYPTWILRLFKKDKGTFERDINEHLNLKGTIGYLKNDFADINRKGIKDWIEKHNKYSTFEALELLNFEKRKKEKKKDEMAKFFGSQAERKRWIREYIWNPLMPPLVRPFFYFFYRYFFKLGFLDGKAGFIYCFLQGLWFPFLIDVKYLEMKRNQKEEN